MNIVYAIINIVNDKRYIGSSCEYEKRVRRHIRDLNNNQHHCKRLQKSWNKYGEDNFYFKVLRKEQIRKTAYKKEEKFLKKYLIKNLLFNSSLTGIAGNLLENHPDKDKLVAKRIKKFKKWIKSLSSDDKKRIYGRVGKLNPMYGKTHTKAARLAMSKANKGKQYALGRKASLETKKKLSKIASLRTGDKNPFFGKSHSDETKKRLSKANKGKLPVNTLKVKIGKQKFDSMTKAAKFLNVSIATIRNRINSSNPKFADYKLIKA